MKKVNIDKHPAEMKHLLEYDEPEFRSLLGDLESVGAAETEGEKVQRMANEFVGTVEKEISPHYYGGNDVFFASRFYDWAKSRGLPVGLTLLQREGGISFSGAYDPRFVTVEMILPSLYGHLFCFNGTSTFLLQGTSHDPMVFPAENFSGPTMKGKFNSKVEIPTAELPEFVRTNLGKAEQILPHIF